MILKAHAEIIVRYSKRRVSLFAQLTTEFSPFASGSVQAPLLMTRSILINEKKVNQNYNRDGELEVTINYGVP